MSILNFHFHHLVGVQVESDDVEVLRFFEAEYRPSSTQASSDLNQVALHWKRVGWPFAEGYHFQMHKFLARWAYKISIHDHRIKIDVIGNRIAVPMIHHMLVHPSMRYLCAQSGAMMLHGSAVVLGNKSLIFTGTGGAGKTTISSLILRYGGNDWDLHADDYVFLGKDRTSFSYMTRSHLYRDQIRWVPALLDCLTARERLHLEFFGRLREITGGRIKWPLRIEPSRLWPNHRIAPQAHLSAVVILTQGNNKQLRLEKIDATEGLIEELVQMNFYEARHFIKLIRRSFGDAFLENWLGRWKANERGFLRKLFTEINLFRLHLPPVEGVADTFGMDLIHILKPIMNADTNEDFDG